MNHEDNVSPDVHRVIDLADTIHYDLDSVLMNIIEIQHIQVSSHDQLAASNAEALLLCVKEKIRTMFHEVGFDKDVKSN